MNEKVYNLDDGIIEYFDFILKGNTYRFRQPNTLEMTEFGVLKDKPELMVKTMSRFITKVTENAPDFEDIANTLTVQYWRRFNEMLEEQLLGKTV